MVCQSGHKPEILSELSGNFVQSQAKIATNKILSLGVVLWCKNAIKYICSRSSSPDHAGVAYGAHQITNVIPVTFLH